jgi:uncharacterized protein YpuA (DUF1002 family)
MTVRGRTEWQKLVDDKLKDHDRRLTEAEKEQAVYMALSEEQRKFVMDRFNRVQDNINSTRQDLTHDITSIKAGINRVLWAVGLAILAAFVQFILSGGIRVPL